MVPSPSETTMTISTSPYRLLGFPTDLDGHVAELGDLPLPHKHHIRHWRHQFGDLLETAGLGGRGGAAFPAAIKLAVAGSGGRGGMVVVNGMEGEPASDKDKLLLLRSPHLVLDGAELLAAAIGADDIVICVPDRRDQIAASVLSALRERQARWPHRTAMRLVRPPDRFIAGEESALAGWIGAGMSLPEFRPDKGTPLTIGRRAVLVHNAETMAHVAMIARRGAESFRARGLAEEPGTMLVTITGAVEHPGVVEVDRGTPLIDVVRRAAPVEHPSALLVGGYGGAWVAPAHFDTPYASLPLRTIGAIAGVGVIVVLGPDSCGLAETARLAHYLAGEGAGQCGPCVYGLPAIAEDVTRLARGMVDDELPSRLARRLQQVNGRGACRHPDGAVALVRSALRVFALDVTQHLDGRPCAHLQTPSRLRLPAS